MGLLPINRARARDHNEELSGLIRLAVAATLQTFCLCLVFDVDGNRGWLRFRLRAVIFCDLTGCAVRLRARHETFFGFVNQKMIDLPARANAAICLREFLPENLTVSARLAITKRGRKVRLGYGEFVVNEPSG